MNHTTKQYLALSVVTLLIFVSCSDLEDKGTEKAKLERRYFFMGYRAANEYKSTDGNIFLSSDTIPSANYVKDLVYWQLYCDNNFFTKERIVIFSVTEFKDSIDFFKFKGATYNPFVVCDTTISVIPSSFIKTNQ